MDRSLAKPGKKAKGTNTGSGSRTRGCRAVSLGDTVHAKVKPECSLFCRAAGLLLLLIHELSVAAVADAAGGSGGRHGRKVILKEKAGKDYMR